jgi:ABC-2 type transport system permease protein
MSMRDLVWAKFWVGTMPLLILALIIVGITDYLLQVTAFMFAVSILSIVGLTFAVCGLAIGFGTIFPQFETENAAQIPTSFGGLLFMMSSVAVIGGVVILEARPVFSYVSAKTQGGVIDPLEMVLGFGAAALLCILATVLPVREALRRLERVER